MDVGSHLEASGHLGFRGSKEHISRRWQPLVEPRQSLVRVVVLLEAVTHPSFHLLQESLN